MKTIVLLSVVTLATVGCLVPSSSLKSGGGDGATASVGTHNLLANGTFDANRSVPWTTSFTAPGSGDGEVEDGAFCVRVDDAGQNRWDAQMRHRDMTIQRGHQYTVKFRAWASAPTTIRPKVGMAGPPYAEYWADTIKLDVSPQDFRGSFMMKARDDASAELAFHIGGDLASTAPLRICIDDVALSDPEFERSEERHEDQAPPAVTVNQLGYLPTRAKVATLMSEATEPQPWQLEDESGTTQLEGMTQVVGSDAASGKSVHLIDFSAFKKSADALVLSVGKHVSYPFAVRSDVYRTLKTDALAYFYHNRSGIDIVMPYAGGTEWTRPAGHLSDKSVPCLPGSGCSYKLDVSGGWYDAGDHGKYVVNGGISVWTMLNQYERFASLREAEQLGDGSLAIPERGNKVSDLLDEARWELAFLLKMQVPEGQPLAGMVHHKIHDVAWTALPLPPHRDEMKRYLYPPSTAATLNVAAVAAQAGRIFRELDPGFSKGCIQAAVRAYRAALAHPNLLAKPGGVGGGPYDDGHVQDEFYWAAVELLITTGDLPSYRDAVTKSPYFRKVTTGGDGSMGGATAMTWQNTESLGNLSLAIVPSALGEAEQRAAREAVRSAADQYLKVSESQGFRQPFAPSADNRYPWGSNSSILNNMLVLALAYDASGDARYIDGVLAGMNYLLGNNPLDQSYVTGYGARPLQNPHHRFWARQIDRTLPPPAPGAVSGGPNSGLEDPYARGAGLKGCAPAMCFVDHIESFSTNEVTINWNAPLAWVAAFLDDVGRRGL